MQGTGECRLAATCYRAGKSTCPGVEWCGRPAMYERLPVPEPRPEPKNKRPSEYMRVTAKRCRKCKRMLPIGEFYRNNFSGDGHEGICKECSHRKAVAAWKRKKEGEGDA